MGIISDWDEYEQVEEWELEDPNEWGCHFPDQCLMAYTDHMMSECHTVEMMEQQMREELEQERANQ